MRDWIKKFVVNRLLYMVLLTVLCLGIFPFVTFFSFTMWIGKRWDSVSSNKTHAKKIEGFWDTIGKPYDYLVKLVKDLTPFGGKSPFFVIFINPRHFELVQNENSFKDLLLCFERLGPAQSGSGPFLFW